MISYLEGKIILKREKFIVLDVHGVGYKVFLSQKTLSKITENEEDLNPSASSGQAPSAKLRVGHSADLSRSHAEQGRSIKLFCFLNVRENLLDLYGFLAFEEFEFFEMLNDISGVGPKMAIEISSLGPLEKIKKAIEREDESLFAGIPGLGKKRTQAIILELSGKITNLYKKKTKEADEAEEALAVLGFPRTKIKETLSKIPSEIRDTETRIKEALKLLGR
jgi:Holliday junction DNA helicase RuvA